MSSISDISRSTVEPFEYSSVECIYISESTVRKTYRVPLHGFGSRVSSDLQHGRLTLHESTPTLPFFQPIQSRHLDRNSREGFQSSKETQTTPLRKHETGKRSADTSPRGSPKKTRRTFVIVTGRLMPQNTYQYGTVITGVSMLQSKRHANGPATPT